ncbi:CbiX/SirB N-terminal domain-containing protein [Streptomyces albulus]|nr:CbiX/SirB N-terminal domain-containing protein [Streptomyces noursei]
MTIRPALLIAGHGTRHEGAADALRALVQVLGEQHPEVPVAGGFFGAPASPLPLSGAVDALVAQGATRLVVVPLLMAPTGPIRETLPEAVARAVAAHPASARSASLSWARTRGCWRPWSDGWTRRWAAVRGGPRTGTAPRCCWWGGARPIRTPTPKWSGPPGCCGRGGASRAWRPRS